MNERESEKTRIARESCRWIHHLDDLEDSEVMTILKTGDFRDDYLNCKKIDVSFDIIRNYLRALIKKNLSSKIIMIKDLEIFQRGVSLFLFVPDSANSDAS